MKPAISIPPCFLIGRWERVSLHCLDTVLAAEGIVHPVRGLGIILPSSVDPETVLVSSGCQIGCDLPVAPVILLHREICDIPAIEIGYQAHFRGSRR